MKSYEFTTPRAAFGIAAVAMTALTFGLSVGAPLKASTAAHGAAPVVAQSAATPMPTEVAIVPARIDVVAARTQQKAIGAVWHAQPKRGQSI